MTCMCVFANEVKSLSEVGWPLREFLVLSFTPDIVRASGIKYICSIVCLFLGVRREVWEM